MNRSRWMKITAAFFALMLCFTILSRAADQAGIAAVQVQKPESRIILHTVAAAGKVVQNREVAIVTEPDERVVEIAVEKGQKVAKGDLLFTIDTELLQEKILNQKQEIEKQKLQLDDAGSQQDVRPLVQGEGLSLGHILPEHTQFPAGLVHGAVGEHHQVDVRRLPGGCQGFLQDLRLDPVVAVRQENPRGFRLPDACVPSASQALVLLVDHPDAAVCLGQSIAKLAAVIGGAVVH